MNGTFGAVVVTLAALASLILWATFRPALDLNKLTCPAPVRVGGQLVSCTGHATVLLPDGSTAVIAPSPGAQARR